MADIKKPQDRKKKLEVVDGHYKVTVQGIEVTVAKDALDDFELLDDLARIENNDAQRIPGVLRRLVGDDFSKVMNGLRGENGRVGLESGTQFIRDLLDALSPNS
ncbi:hypothetical protein D9V32_13460 [Mycetocola tolaasinivorans]|uniref:Uncharacterized protein n=1 Tax=Mycetocola tolaasinivorans TaxID=76635 RepID=A0A3L7A2V4_9MICO|nr:hypothetical protein [Mycetocola tolaasinivorans]RLP74350.1 hypothetical protein D9V32_13460 [Mycetocola tolaasinivorans]